MRAVDEMPAPILRELRGGASGQRNLMKVRQATHDDAADVLDWRNDAHTRAMSKNSDVVDKDRHLAWFDAALGDPRRLVFIGELHGKKIGMVRFDYEHGSWSVNINVSPGMRGEGHGFVLLRDGIALLRKMGNTEKVIAEVKAENANSFKMFESCGFSVCGKDERFFYFSLV